VRHRSSPRAALFVCVLSAAVGAVAQTPPSPAPAAPARATIRWERDFDAALARAQAEKKPLFVAFLMDDEPANDETIQQHYTDPQIVELTARFVCLVCNIGEHRCDEGCKKFPGITCAQHQAIEKKARQRWLVGDLVCTPQHVFCDCKGEVVLRRVYLIPKEALAKSLVVALTRTGSDVDGLSREVLALADADRAQVDTWLKDLDGPNLELKEAALRGLAYADDLRALPAVLQRCGRDSDEAVRLAAIGALARKGNYQAVGTLVKLLDEPKAPVLIRIASTLDTIEMPEAGAALLATAKKEKRDRVLGVMLRALANVQRSNADVRELCLKTMKTASTQLKAHTIVALGRLDPDPKIAQALLAQLDSRNQNMRGLSVWALGNQRTPQAQKALEGLQKQEKTPEVRQLLDAALKRCRGEVVEGYESKYSTFLVGDY
jgi:HEAT repeat protein